MSPASPSGTARPRIAVIGTGGTISSLGADSLDSLDYPEFGAKLTPDEVLARVPEARLVADPFPVPFRTVGSTAIGPADWVALRDLIRATAAQDPSVAGFVVTHGTATLEETAFFLDLTLDVPRTVVLVGAQRPISALGTDAGSNLVAALRVAGAPEARGRGVLVVLNDEVHAARDVVKTSTYRLQTFRSPDYGPLGQVDGDGLHLARTARRGPGFAGAPLDALPRVDIVLSYGGADGTMVAAAVAAGARGIVSAGLAPGIATPAERAALEDAIGAGVAVVQCSRAAGGRVGRRRYLRESGFVAGEDFSPQKARILLMLALAAGADTVGIREAFAAH